MSALAISEAACPVCGGTSLERILEIKNIPVFCNIQLESRDEALRQPVGDMHLEFCRSCKHVFNSAFDMNLLQYSERYENSLHFSATFTRFAEDLARRLVDRYELSGKRVIDIGCGKGDFLSSICELGGNEGFGFDKSYEEGRARIPSRGSVEYFQDYFSRKYADLEPDFVTCRHVLEHIPSPGEFLDEIIASIGQGEDCALYFEVPNLLFTLRDFGIWDLIYEHCQYFSPQSLARAFERDDVKVNDIYDCFGRQFLALEARCLTEKGSPNRRESKTAEHVASDAVDELSRQFESEFQAITERWKDELTAQKSAAVVWGAGSKGTTFLNLLDGTECIAAIVDINPNKQGKFVPCTGHEIIAPEELKSIDPQVVYIMNPMYREEIRSQLDSLDIRAETRVVD